MLANHKSKRSRPKRNQSSTTLQFAPPNWLSKIFRKSSTVFQRETSFGYPWQRNFFPTKILSKVSSIPFIFPKLLYIFLCAGMGSVIPYLPIFYNASLKLTSTQIGIVFSLAPFISAISCPLWTGLADRYQTHRQIIVVIYCLATLGVLSQMFLPSFAAEESSGGFMMSCVLFTAIWFAFFGIPVNALVDSGVIKILGDKKELYGQQRLWGSFSYGASTLGVGLLWSAVKDINIIFFFFLATSLLFVISTLLTDFNPDKDSDELPIRSKDIAFKPLVDLEDQDEPAASSSRDAVRKYRDYDTEAINNLDHIEESDGEDSSVFDEDNDDDAVSVPDLDILAFAPTAPNLTTASLSTNPIAAIKTLLRNPSVATLLAVMLLMGTALSMSNSFLLLFLSQELKASSTVLGLTGLFSASTELLFFFYSKDLISRFGIVSLVSLAHIVTIIRCTTYIFLKENTFSYVMALLVQFLNGIGFSALWASGVMHISNNAPSNLISFSQGVMTALYAGIGTGFGSLIGGLLYDTAGGPRVMFGVVVAISIISLIVYWWGENGFEVNIDHFGGKRRRQEIMLPWEGETGGAPVIMERRSTLSVETARTKKGRYEMLLQDDDDEQYHYGVFGEGR
ncbi:9797_t:CDS:2 [Acaulospora morrowiae]|uniref:9797_t:CDS:1 n=1 Tax=Acaulospora morrowiae TaxID=94023 RepID=A0A9N9A8G6_9GLOM|nr:9797_t:CDS:2 [Acaulospora morrowiae]